MLCADMDSENQKKKKKAKDFLLEKLNNLLVSFIPTLNDMLTKILKLLVCIC